MYRFLRCAFLFFLRFSLRATLPFPLVYVFTVSPSSCAPGPARADFAYSPGSELLGGGLGPRGNEAMRHAIKRSGSRSSYTLSVIWAVVVLPFDLAEFWTRPSSYSITVDLGPNTSRRTIERTHTTAPFNFSILVLPVPPFFYNVPHRSVW